MAHEFKLPEIGEGTAEGEIIKWLVAVGDVVTEDQPLVEVMTDKATVEIPSPHGGTVAALRAEEGEVVDVGSVILVFGEAGDAEDSAPAAATPAPEEAPPAPVVAGAQVPAEDPVQAARAMARAELEEFDTPDAGTSSSWEAPTPAAGRVAATPATRRLARELGIDLLTVQGTGKGGRVMKADVLQAHEQSGQAADVPPAPSAPVVVSPTPIPAPTVSVTPATPSPVVPAIPRAAREASAQGPREERIPFRGLRRKIAQRMHEAKQVIPHYTYVEECDMTEIVGLRRQAKAQGAPHGVKVTFLPFIVKALVAAAKQHPIVNSSLDDAAGEIVLKRYYNVGIATASERGLFVPVVKDADRLGIFELAREIERLASDAREGRSQLEDLQGGTITITSTGNIGGVLATPIINQPEVAILGVTAIRQRPVVRDGEIVIRDMVNLSLSLDHRIVDGAEGAVFMRDLVAYLEDPKLLLLGTP
jgi:pyruvate dehydrogenase E2 component (dihydrolipoamide acetyltransferase)